MAFGQASGPPATRAQIDELAELLEQVGFESFREARHPYGLTQRQSNGKFTRGEAEELLDRLRGEVDGEPRPEADAAPDGDAGSSSDARPEPSTARPRASRGASPGASAADPPAPAPPAPDEVALAFPDEVLAAELRRRGWTCTPPS